MMAMPLFSVLQMLDPEVSPEKCKVHLATWNGREHPLDVYRAGGFEDWQGWQTQKNFGQPLIVALIALPERDSWLFAGVYGVLGVKRATDSFGMELWRYETREREATRRLSGRAVIEHRRSGRSSYRVAESCWDLFEIVAIEREPLGVEDFSGYTARSLRKWELDLIVARSVASWRVALSSVSGVYVVSDGATGKLYVGSATGAGGIWERWCAYSRDGHGGNTELRRVLSELGPKHAENFSYGVLETANTTATKAQILARESHWKRLLLSRTHGYNAN